jgi:hypothetical protein
MLSECCPDTETETVVAFMKLVRGRLGLLGIPSYTHQISIKYSPRGVTCSDLVMAASA